MESLTALELTSTQMMPNAQGGKERRCQGLCWWLAREKTLFQGCVPAEISHHVGQSH